LVKRLREAGADAAEALVSTYGARAYRLALRITGTEADAEDVVRDALWTVVRRVEMFRGDAMAHSERGYIVTLSLETSEACSKRISF
jgi:RNA polymerase sigma-70 factor (ECF subfamily)